MKQITTIHTDETYEQRLENFLVSQLTGGAFPAPIHLQRLQPDLYEKGLLP